MKFIVTDEVFKKLENVMFGIVIAKGINNKKEYPEIKKILSDNINLIEGKFQNRNVKGTEEINPYREAFLKLGINPNKFMSSIEAMTTRIAKKKGFPNINSIVDIANAVSLKYLVPLGAHDLESSNGDIFVRFSNKGDQFIPFGEQEAEVLEEGELIYSIGKRVKTRRWIWRQSEEGKVTEDSSDIFFPIDGFTDKNFDNVINARNELADLLQRIFNCEIKVGLIDKNKREIEI